MAAPIVTNVCSQCGVSFKAKGTRTRQCSSECYYYANTRPDGECIVWTKKSKGHYGYGRACRNNVEIGAHRFSYVTFNGPLGDGLHVCHTCDNPSCVNPAHLFAGTHKDNVQDMLRKGRSKIGRSDNYASKLTRDDVIAIRNDGRHDAELAAECGVCESTIYLARTRRTWADVD